MLMVSNGTNKWENRGNKEVLIDRRTMWPLAVYYKLLGERGEIVCHLHLMLCKVQTQRNVCSLVNYYGLSKNRVYLQENHVAIGCLLQTLGGKKKKEEIVCHLH
jgi:hypothetical protein